MSGIKMDIKQFLGGISQQEFLDEYWEKKPLLVRGAIKDAPSYISLKDMQELACSDYVESRIVLEDDAEEPWQLINGPFTPEVFTTKHIDHCYTLLCHGVNHYLPKMNQLEKLVGFIPHCHFDDVMVSYSKEGGNVGPHIDTYNAFIVQGHGKKRWQLSASCPENYHEDKALKILKEFSPEIDWVLEEGDMIYMPPRLAHYGVALNEGMSYSIGFKSLSYHEILKDYMAYMFECYSSDKFHTVDLKSPVTDTNLISDTFKSSMHNILKDELLNDDHINQWMGEKFTEPKQYPEADDELPFSEFLEEIKEGRQVIRDEYLRYSVIKTNNESAIFINTQKYELEYSQITILIEMLEPFPMNSMDISKVKEDDELIEILYELYRSGAVYFTVMDDD
jgi:50S ribosomal protein L16 3-hydroxylase